MIEMLILIDLDGVLTDTAEPEYKKYKDGTESFDINIIPVIDGAIDFIERLKKRSGTQIAVISDSHPRYVQPIVAEFFNIPFLALADKPNISKTKTFIKNTFGEISNFCRRTIMIGDSWLDIELARGLEIPSIYTKLYKFKSIDIRDGLGDHDRSMKSGPTFEVNTFEDIDTILLQPKKKLLCLEAFFNNEQSFTSRQLSSVEVCGKTKTIISLGRQQLGSCDRFGLINQYNEFQKPNRRVENIRTLTDGLNFFLSNFLIFRDLSDPILTYIPEKTTTTNPRKMVEVWDKLDSVKSKMKLFEWVENTYSSIRNMAHRNVRQRFLETHLSAVTESLLGRDVIVLDDQITTGATAETAIKKLWEKGANNIFFVTFFYLINLVVTDKICPNCGKFFQIKVRKSDGTRFLSCLPPKYGGKGCGTNQNL